MAHPLGSAERPLRIAIVGAGPAGFYTAEALLKQKDLACTIDIFNRFPTPFGLVREGVAPDHQSIKAVTRVYDKIADHPHVRYFGNVTIGEDLTRADLLRHYDQVVYAFGAQSDRRMGIPGEDLDGSMPATAFVGWYNGRPDYQHITPNLNTERVVVVGNGNVAMDVARILVTDPAELALTDIADQALEALRTSHVREVIMLGRRGPAQAAFTNAELKEFGVLAGVDCIIDAADMDLDDASTASLLTEKIAAKNVELLKTYAARTPSGAARRVIMRFLCSPVAILGDDNGAVRAVRLERNELVPDGNGGLKARGTGVFEEISCGMVLRSVGYKGTALEDIPFDAQRGTIRNQGGRVVDEAGNALPGEYCVGWIKRGPSGVIGTNKPDAVATVQAMLADATNLAGAAEPHRDPATIIALLDTRKPDYVTYTHWRTLDAHEAARGAAQGRPRVKVTSVPEMLAVIGRKEA